MPARVVVDWTNDTMYLSKGQQGVMTFSSYQDNWSTVELTNSAPEVDLSSATQAAPPAPPTSGAFAAPSRYAHPAPTGAKKSPGTTPGIASHTASTNAPRNRKPSFENHMPQQFNATAAQQFLALLGKPAGAPTRIRGIKPGSCLKATYDPATIQQWMDDGRSVYVVIGHPRPGTNGDSKASIASCPAYFAEYDDGRSLADQLHAILDAGLPAPTFIAFTGGKSHHLYWVLDQPHPDPLRWQQEQKRLISLIGSDRSVNDPSRVMRLPGTIHSGTGQPVTLLPNRLDPVPLSLMQELLLPPPPPAPRPSDYRASSSPDRTARHALEQLQRIPPRIPGTNTRDQYLRLLWGLTAIIGADAAADEMTRHSPEWAAIDNLHKLAGEARGDISGSTFFHIARAEWNVTSARAPQVASTRDPQAVYMPRIPAASRHRLQPAITTSASAGPRTQHLPGTRRPGDRGITAAHRRTP